MIFNSIIFGIFFPLVFFFYHIVFCKRIKLRNTFLIGVSYFFYGWWDWRFLGLIIFSSIIDFIIGLNIFKEENERRRKRLLFLSIFINLGILGFFKYCNFFIESFTKAFSLFIEINNVSTLNVLLPVGISFYTFQTLSYTIDIYRRKLEPTRDITAFFAFVAFFPQLVAGPIERAKDLLPQFFDKRPISYAMLRSGLFLMAWGFFKKIVIANRLAIFVDSAYGGMELVDSSAALIAIIFFSFQLYLDFSAYSDIAIGCARMLGFDLSKNFNRPYLSKSFSDFWQRWHISLSSWFKDYLYIPLGGNRKGNAILKRNIIIVFILSGLWHGASWNFVIWGCINALFIVFFDVFLKKFNNSIYSRIVVSSFIYASWALSLVFFRAQSFDQAKMMYSKLWSGNNGDLFGFGLNSLEFSFTIKILIAYVLFEIVQERFSDLYKWFCSLNFILRWVVYISLIGAIIFYGSYGVGLNDNNFIYFQF